MTRLPDALVAVDQELIRKAQAIEPTLQALRARYHVAQQNPRASATDLAHLGTAIDELERTLGRIRFGASGEHVENAPAPVVKSKTSRLVVDLRKAAAARAASGQFARHGSAAHLAGHRRAYHGKRESGEIAGTRADWGRHLQRWRVEKDTHQTGMLQELRHLEADARGLDPGPELTKLQKRIARLRGKLQARGVKV